LLIFAARKKGHRYLWHKLHRAYLLLSYNNVKQRAEQAEKGKKLAAKRHKEVESA